MRALLFLLPSLALAQPAPGGSCKLNSTQCTAAKNTSGTNTGDVTLATFGAVPAAAGASLSGQVLTLQPADGTHGGGISLLAQTMGAGDKLFGGKLLGTFTVAQYIDLSYNGDSIKFATGTGSGGDFQFSDRFSNNFLDVDVTGLVVGSVRNPVPVIHVAQTGSPVAMEFGRTAASAAGALTVTFATAFAAAPTCVCTDENAVPVICGITTAPTTTAVVLGITAARADTIDWHCHGLK